MTYEEFLMSKEIRAEACGFDIDRDSITPYAFDYQKDIITWACKKGKCAILTGCGTGKTLMLLEWGRAVHEQTGKPVLIVSPLSVVNQTQREAKKFEICTVNVCRKQEDVVNGVNITNYEMEGAALQGLAKLMGHRAITICSIIANRVATVANPNYKTAVNDLVKTVIERLMED